MHSTVVRENGHFMEYNSGVGGGGGGWPQLSE